MCILLQGMFGVLELAASTLCMLSQRPAAHSLLRSCGAVAALISLLSPLYTSATVENAASALGNLSADSACRHVLRSSGGVGALVRLLKPDCPTKMQVCFHAGC